MWHLVLLYIIDMRVVVGKRVVRRRAGHVGEELGTACLCVLSGGIQTLGEEEVYVRRKRKKKGTGQQHHRTCRKWTSWPVRFLTSASASIKATCAFEWKASASQKTTEMSWPTTAAETAAGS